MVHTPFCDLLDIRYPIVQAAIYPATSPELVAAVSNAGGLGSLGAIFESAESIQRQIAAVRMKTDKPFVVNHVVPNLNEEAFEATLEARPAAVSLALGDPGALVERAHSAGMLVIHQVHTVEQARRVAELGVDVIIAQGSEAGGQGLAHGPSTMVLVPQVVDAVDPIPVLAAGGVADGRGLAAVLALGAQGANIGTRFLASREAGVAEAWRQMVVSAGSEDTTRFENWKSIMPASSSTAYDAVPRLIRTSFVERWSSDAADTAEHAAEIRAEIIAALQTGRLYELVPFAGQTAGLVNDILPAGEIVRRIVSEADQVRIGTPSLAA